jgi:hypothetical protein
MQQPRHQHFTRASKRGRGPTSSCAAKTRQTSNADPDVPVRGQECADTCMAPRSGRPRPRDKTGRQGDGDETDAAPNAPQPEHSIDRSGGTQTLAHPGYAVAAGEVPRAFVEDTATVSVHDFSDRIYDIVSKMCDCNARRPEASESSLGHLLASADGENHPLWSLVSRLVVWHSTSRSVVVVALILLDRLQRAEHGAVATARTVQKLFSLCMLLAKKTVEDAPA